MDLELGHRTALENLDLSTAVGRWLEGQRVDSDLLYDFPILWLGRIGKCLQFLGALTIIVEIAGTERLRMLGARLKSEDARVRAAERLRNSAKWLGSILTRFHRRKDSEKHVQSDKELQKLEDHPAAILNGFLAIVAAALAWRHSPFDSLWATISLSAVIFYLSGALVGPIISYTLVVLAFIMADMILEPIAHLLDRERPDLWIKVGAFVFVVVGFLLDMLAS